MVTFLRGPHAAMLLLDNLRYRFREWQDQPVDPDLVPRLRRLWRPEPGRPAPERSAPPRPGFLLTADHAARVRRAG